MVINRISDIFKFIMSPRFVRRLVVNISRVMIYLLSLVFLVQAIFAGILDIDISYYIINNRENTLLFVYSIIVIIITLSFFATYLFDIDPDSDKAQRSDSSDWELFERRVLSEVDRRLKKVTIKDSDFPDDFRRLIEKRIDKEIISTIDESLKGQVENRAKINRVIDHMDLVTNELKIRLEGPASRAETSAAWARRAAYFMAVVGLLIAVGRVMQIEDVSGHILSLYKLTDDKSIWPYVTMQAAPWVGLILLVEFTALLFLRFANRATALQRYFTEGLAELRDRHLAMRTIIEFGTPEQVVFAAKSMIIYGSRVLDDDKDAATLAAASNMMGNFTDAVKSAASKMGGKSGA